MENIAAPVTVAPKVGDILSSSWGYDQTNVDFYKVLRFTGKSVVIQRIESDTTEEGFMCGHSVPHVPHTASKYRGEPMTKRVNYHGNGYGVKITDYASAYLWDGQPERTSWYA